MADTPSTRAPSPSAGQSTRQLLDELDTLMQRMLALPVQEAEDGNESGSESNNAKNETPASAGPRKVTLRAAPSQPATVQEPATSDAPSLVVAGQIPAFWPASSRTATTQSTDDDSSDLAAPAPPSAQPMLPILLQRPRVPADQKGSVLPQRAATSQGNSPATPRPVWLKTPVTTVPEVEPMPPDPSGLTRWLLIINGAFDLMTLLFGPLGRWLRSDQGRSLVGLAGFTMVVAAVIWGLILICG